jgi:RNA-directed DNA polymerase
MAREFPSVRFERYVDDAVEHCVSERQAGPVLAALQKRMVEGRAAAASRQDPDRVLPGRKRRNAFEHTSFTFLGYTFRPRGARAMGREHVPVLRARDQQGRLDEDRALGPVLETAPPYRAILLRARAVGESHCAGLDAVLRRLLSVGAVSPPDAYQRLLDALGPHDIAGSTDDASSSRRGSGSPHGTRGSSLTGLDPRRPSRLVIKVIRAV